MQKFLGLPASPGIAIGPAWAHRPATVTVERRAAAVRDPYSHLCELFTNA